MVIPHPATHLHDRARPQLRHGSDNPILEIVLGHHASSLPEHRVSMSVTPIPQEGRTPDVQLALVDVEPGGHVAVKTAHMTKPLADEAVGGSSAAR